MSTKIMMKSFVAMLCIILSATASSNSVTCCMYGDGSTCYINQVNGLCPSSSATGAEFQSDNSTGGSKNCIAGGGAAGSGGGNVC